MSDAMSLSNCDEFRTESLELGILCVTSASSVHRYVV